MSVRVKGIKKTLRAIGNEQKAQNNKAADIEIKALTETTHRVKGRLANSFRKDNISKYGYRIYTTVPYAAVEFNYHPGQLKQAQKIAQPKLKRQFKKTKKV